MIKTQTAVNGVRREGGRKEGRRSVSWRDGGQAGYAEGEGGGEGGGETQGWLVPSRGCVLTDALYTLVSNRGAQNTGWPLPDVQHTVEHQYTHTWTGAWTSTNTHVLMQFLQTQACKYMHTVSLPCRWQIGVG